MTELPNFDTWILIDRLHKKHFRINDNDATAEWDEAENAGDQAMDDMQDGDE